MKKRKIYLAAAMITLFVLASAGSLFAEATQTWRWAPHRVKFDLPKSFKVKMNNKDTFIAKGEHDVTIKIQTITAEDAKAAAENGYNSYTVVLDKQILQQRELSADASGLTRYMIYGTGKSSRTKSPAKFGIVGLKNPRTGVTLYARFWWFDKHNGTYGPATFKIANSFRSY